MKILIINGPNMNLLGIREPHIYGTESYAQLCDAIEKHAHGCGVEVEFYQSNHEGDLIDRIQQAYGKIDGIIINPAAYTHTSIALADALRSVAIPAVEVHLTDIFAREAYRRVSYTREACIACISGEGFNSYLEAVNLLVRRHES